MKLSVTIPVYNEQSTILDILKRVCEAALPDGVEREIVVVDDCSTDGTRDILKGLELPGVRVVFHDKNQGKGAALKTGFNHCTGDMVLVQDADLEYDPAEYFKLIAPILAGKADVVYGSRFAGGEAHRVLYFWHYVANRVLTTLSNAFSDLNLTDLETCYKVFRKDALDGIEIKSDRFGFEPEITAKMIKAKKRLYEVPISYYGRTYEEGKKITWKDGFKAVAALIRFRFTD